MSLNVANLRHRVRFDEFVAVEDSNGNTQDPDSGAPLRDWREFDTVWASIEPLSAREFIASGAKQAEATARITRRWRAGLHAGMRAVHLVNGVAATVYDVVGVLADRESGREYVTLPVREGVNEGE